MQTVDSVPGPGFPASQALPTEPELTPEEAALVAETCSKSQVIWLKVAGEQRTHLAWHVWHEDAVHLIQGIEEQQLPLLAGMVEVVARSKDTGTRMVTFLARADVLPAGSPEWDAAAQALSASRLNTQDPDKQRERWASGGLITRLTPIRLVASGAGDAGTPSGSVPPPPTGATTGTWRPWHLSGRPQQRRGTPRVR